MHDIDKQLDLMLRGQFDQAWQISQKLESQGAQGILDPQGKPNPEMWNRHQFNRAWFLLQQGDLQTGSQLLEHGRHIGVYGGGVLPTNAPLYNPTTHDIQDKSIILSLEGGFGDEVIHVRFAQSFKKLGARTVIVACSPELTSIFKRVPGVDVVIQRDEAHTVPHDYWCPGFSAAWVCGHQYDDLPQSAYLSANDMSMQIWSGIITATKPKVGIRWAGNPKFEHQQFRKFPVEFMFELAKYDQIQLYSLQRDNNLEPLPDNVIDIKKWLIGWEDTVAAISHLDLVITSCTSIAHVSAALGKPTWVVTPILPYHTWVHGAPESTTTPWYPTVKLYRQQQYQKWNVTFQQLYDHLEQKFDLLHVTHDDHDHEPRKLNLGSGTLRLEGYVNVDKSPHMNPDQVVDLEQTPWPWKDNEFNHVVAKDILEHLGQTPAQFLNIIQEMYRVSRNGAVWEIQTPHWRSDNLLNDPTHVRAITPAMMEMFNQKHIMWTVKEGLSHSSLAFDLRVDVEICDTKYDFTSIVKDRISQGTIDQTELDFMFNTLNNIAESTRMLIEVHKPGRYTIEEFQNTVKARQHAFARDTQNLK